MSPHTHDNNVEVRPVVYSSLGIKNARIEIEGREVVVDL